MQRFVDTRAYLVRKSDGHPVYGWVLEAMPGRIVLEMTKNDDVAMGQVFDVRLSSSKNCASFEAKICRKYVDRIYLDSPDQLRIGPPLEPIRRRSPVSECLISDSFGDTAKAKLLDIGPNGMGVESPVMFNPEEVVTVSISTQTGVMTAEARVVYCGSNRDTNTFRAGLSILRMDRLSTGHWKTLLSAA